MARHYGQVLGPRCEAVALKRAVAVITIGGDSYDDQDVNSDDCHDGIDGDEERNYVICRRRVGYFRVG